MSTPALIRRKEGMPSIFDDFFKPWNEWFDNRNLTSTMNIPAVNITEEKDRFLVTLAAPGLKKEDFNLNMDGNMLTISCEKEDSQEEKDKKYTRKEYNFMSFSRTFTLPDEILKENIEAHYQDGILNITLPRKEQAKMLGKHIPVK